MNIKPYILVTSLLLKTLIFSHFSVAAENNADKNTAPPSQTPKNMPFFTSLAQLEKDHSADESFWINLDNQKTLVLNYWAKGKKRRGNVILLHSPGENADHPRLIYPLSKQLSALGWNVFIPNLPKEDFLPIKEKIELETPASETKTPEKLAEKEDTLQKANSLSKKYFFADDKEYQQIFNKLLEEVINKIPQSEDNLLVITSQNTSYWVLDKLKSDPKINFVAFLAPETPSRIKVNLKTSFELQKLPLFAFFPENDFSLQFSNAFKQNFWKVDNIRINRNLISQQGIILEDNQISKLISGWIESKKQ